MMDEECVQEVKGNEVPDEEWDAEGKRKSPTRRR